jgi:hypothetical protein
VPRTLTNPNQAYNEAASILRPTFAFAAVKQNFVYSDFAGTGVRIVKKIGALLAC